MSTLLKTLEASSNPPLECDIRALETALTPTLRGSTASFLRSLLERLRRGIGSGAVTNGSGSGSGSGTRDRDRDRDDRGREHRDRDGHSRDHRDRDRDRDHERLRERSRSRERPSYRSGGRDDRDWDVRASTSSRQQHRTKDVEPTSASPCASASVQSAPPPPPRQPQFQAQLLPPPPQQQPQPFFARSLYQQHHEPQLQAQTLAQTQAQQTVIYAPQVLNPPPNQTHGLTSGAPPPQQQPYLLMPPQPHLDATTIPARVLQPPLPTHYPQIRPQGQLAQQQQQRGNIGESEGVGVGGGSGSSVSGGVGSGNSSFVSSGDRSARTLIVRTADSAPLPNIAVLSTHFSIFGNISNVLILKDSAFVQFSSHREASAARGSTDAVTLASGARVTLGWARHDPLAPSDAPPWVGDALARDASAVKPYHHQGWGTSAGASVGGAYGAASVAAAVNPRGASIPTHQATSPLPTGSVPLHRRESPAEASGGLGGLAPPPPRRETPTETAQRILFEKKRSAEENAALLASQRALISEISAGKGVRPIAELKALMVRLKAVAEDIKSRQAVDSAAVNTLKQAVSAAVSAAVNTAKRSAAYQQARAIGSCSGSGAAKDGAAAGCPPPQVVDTMSSSPDVAALSRSSALSSTTSVGGVTFEGGDAMDHHHLPFSGLGEGGDIEIEVGDDGDVV